MHIEAHGGFQSPKKETRPLRFCCTNCKCKFVADPGEYIEGKKNTNAYTCKDPKPRIKLYASVCPECNEVVMLPGSSAHFVTKPLEPIDIYNHAGRKVKLVSKRPDIPSGIYKVVDSGIKVMGKDTEYVVEAKMELLDAEYFSEPIYVSYDSRLSEDIEIYALEEA